MTCSQEKQLDRLLFSVLLQLLADLSVSLVCLLLLRGEVAGAGPHPTFHFSFQSTPTLRDRTVG